MLLWSLVFAPTRIAGDGVWCSRLLRRHTPEQKGLTFVTANTWPQLRQVQSFIEFSPLMYGEWCVELRYARQCNVEARTRRLLDVQELGSVGQNTQEVEHPITHYRSLQRHMLVREITGRRGRHTTLRR